MKFNQKRLAKAIVLGLMLGAFASTSNIALAENVNAGLATKEQYVAIRKAGDNNPSTDSITYQECDLDVHDSNGDVIKGEKVTYWVKEGYNASKIYVERQRTVLSDGNDVVKSDNPVGEYQDVVKIIAGGLLTSDTTTLATAQVVVLPTTFYNGEAAKTVGGSTLNRPDVSSYAAVTNAGGVEADAGWDYVIEDKGKWVNATKGTGGTSKVQAVYDPHTGKFKYTINGTEHYANIENTYFLTNGKEEATPYVFLKSDKSLYTGTVYGSHNEILLTGVDSNEKIYTYWGTKNDDNDTLLSQSGMTVGALNREFSVLVENDQKLAVEDIKNIQITPESGVANKGKISLIRNDDDTVAGSLTFQSIAESGKDVQIKISNYPVIKSDDGSYIEDINATENSFVLNVGSVVKANSGDTTVGEIEKISINGINYSIGSNYLTINSGYLSSLAGASSNEYHGWEIQDPKQEGKIFKDTTLKAGDAVESIIVDTEGNPTGRMLTIYDTAGNAVVLKDIAKDSELQKVSSQVVNNENSITNINNLLDGGFKVADNKSHEATIKLGKTITFEAKGAADVTVDTTGRVVVKATDTKYQITEKGKDVSTPANVVKTYNFKEIGSSEEGFDFVDTDTKYTAGTGITIDPNNNNQISIIPNAVANSVSISYKANNETAKSVSLSDGLNFVQGGNVQISTGANGVVNISATDTNTYTTSASYDANTKTATFTRNDGKTYDLNLSTITSGLGSMSSWYAKVGETTKEISDGNTLEFVGGSNANVTMNENGVITISAIDTNTQNTTVGDQNITVDKSYQEDGTIEYTVKTKDDVEFNSVTVGKTPGFNGVVISSSGINMNNQKITGLEAGTEDSDAVNFGQLKEYATKAGSNTKVSAGDDNISVNHNTSNNGENEYIVGLNNNVTLGSDDENGSLVVKSNVGDMLISNGQIIGDKYALTNDGGAIFANGVISAAGDGTFRAANGSFTVFADGTVDSKMDKDGRLLITNEGLSVAKGSSSFGVTGAGISLSWGESALVVDEGGTAIKGGLNVLGSKITNVAAGEVDTDAVNVGQLREAIAARDTHIKSGVYQVGEVSLDEEGNKSQGVSIDVVDGSGKVTGNVKITDVAKASDLGDVSKLHADLKNSESNVTTVVDAVNKLNGKVGDLQYLEVTKGDIENGDNTTTAIGKLNQALKDVSQKATAHNTVSNADTNITITISKSTNSDGGTNYALALNKQKINLGNVIIEGEKGSITAKNVTAGKTSIGDAGVQFDGKTYIGDKGLNANDQKITNVAAGELSKTSKDAVNGSQLYATNQQVNQNTANINSLDNRISKLGSRVNKVGAGAAALAALHPMDFDPDDKLSFAVGMGNYAGENAAAIGAFYRPNEKVMMSVGGTYGNDENMVNVGLSFALDRTNNVSNSRTAMAHEIVELRAHVAKQDQQIAQLTALVNKLVGKDAVKGEGVLFPDVPENHWAYEYINGLVQAGVIDGYPDGTFGGERSLTRYEYASMLYKAMLKGTILNRDIVKEFESEIARIRVDRISGNDNDANKIERVRVNYQNRDNYGTRIAK